MKKRGKFGRPGQARDDNIIRRVRFACWIFRGTDTHSEYEISIDFLQLKWLRECAWILRLYVLCPSLFAPNNIWQVLQIMTLFNLKFSPACCSVLLDSAFLISWYILLDRPYTAVWCIVHIVQLTTELYVSTLQGHHQAYKIMVLTKAYAVLMWCNVYIMQLTTELNVSTLQDHHQDYKIMVLTKAHAVLMWCNVYIMQLTTELHVSTLQGHHQAYKIMVLTKAHAVIPHLPWLIPLFYKPNDDPVGSKHVVQLLVALYKHCTTLLCNDGPIKYNIIRTHNGMENPQFKFPNISWRYTNAVYSIFCNKHVFNKYVSLLCFKVSEPETSKSRRISAVRPLLLCNVLLCKVHT